MKSSFIFVTCLLVCSLCNIDIPLKQQTIQVSVNNVQKDYDSVLYAKSTIDHLGSATKVQDENILFDIASTANYVLSSSTKYGPDVVSTTAFDCNGLCEQGTAQTTATSVLGGKGKLAGGQVLTATSKVEIDEKDLAYNLYVPTTVDQTTSANNLAALKFANAGLGLGRSPNSIVSQLFTSSKQVTSKEFSVYAHDTIGQLNIGGINQYFAQGTNKIVIPTVDKTSWRVAVSNIKTKTGSVLKGTETLNANFDTTSKFIYIPNIAPTQNQQQTIPGFYYFMTSQNLPCFKPDTNVANTFSYICEANNFPGFSEYSPITFTFKTGADTTSDVTFDPTEYIIKNADGAYELLFKLSTAPQNIGEIYFGTTFFKKFYPTFNEQKNTVTLQNNYQVQTGSLNVSNDYFIPFVVVGSLLTIVSVAALLAILKKVKVDQEPSAIEMPQYQVNNTTGYNPIVNSSQTNIVNPLASTVNTNYNVAPVSASVYQAAPSTNSLYAPATNVNYTIPQNLNNVQYTTQNVVVTNSNILRQQQSPVQVRQSQTQIRQSQNIVQPQYVIRQNF